MRAKISSRTKLVILNSPSNPTGSVLSEKELGDIASSIRGTGIFVLSDEVYSRIVYEGEAKSIASVSGMKQQTIVADGFSKTYCMTGWRLGYGIMNQELAAHVTRLLINSNSCTAHFVQRAGIEALRGPQDSVDAMVNQYRIRRDFVVASLNSMKGITCREPRGAFYAFPNVSGTGLDGSELASYLLKRAGVAVLSGSAFGNAAKAYLRLSFASGMEMLRTGLEAIQRALKSLPEGAR